MDGPGEYYAKWNKPGSKKQIPYDLTYKLNLINKKISKQHITIDIEIKNKLTVTKGGGEGNNGGKQGEGHQGTCIKDTWTKPKGG